MKTSVPTMTADKMARNRSRIVSAFKISQIHNNIGISAPPTLIVKTVGEDMTGMSKKLPIPIAKSKTIACLSVKRILSRIRCAVPN